MRNYNSYGGYCGGKKETIEGENTSSRFIRDVVNATKSRLSPSDKEVLVIDAGCGPYLFLELSALLLDPSRVRLVCSELNRGSLIAAKIISE